MKKLMKKIATIFFLIALLLTVLALFASHNYLMAVGILLLYICFKNKISFLGLAAILIAVLMILFFPYQTYLKQEFKEWNDLLQKKVEQLGNIKVTKEGIEMGFNITAINTSQPGPESNEPPISFEPSKHDVTLSMPENIIQNGDFNIPIESEFSAWGHGLYSDQFISFYPNLKIVWINFLNANINVKIEETEKGNALRIDRKSKREDHRVGIMEQYIVVEPGTYKFSFWAKAKGLETNALQFTTTDEWNADLGNGGYELKEGGSFEWKPFERKIKIKEGGRKTFTITSKAPGTIYLTQISLVKAKEH